MNRILMKSENFINYSSHISAVLPEYDKNGNNICKIIYENGNTEIIIMGLEKFLTQWAYSFNMLLASQRMWARTELHIKNRVPLVMNEDIVLFPIKTRKILGPKDGCCGYIHKSSIKHFDDHHIYLHNGIKIPYFSAKKTLVNKINQAKQLKLTYKDQFMIQQRIYNNTEHEQIDNKSLKQLESLFSLVKDTLSTSSV